MGTNEECNNQSPKANHLKILKNAFGYNFFERKQWDAIRSIIFEKKDIFINAGVSFGKCLVYQFPPVFLKKTAIVILPTIALIKHRISSIDQKQINTVLFDPTQRLGSHADFKEKLSKCRLIYMKAEHFNFFYRKYLDIVRKNVCIVAIEDCHVMEKDETISLGSLERVKDIFPNVPVIYVTKAVTKETQTTIIKSLKLVCPLVVKTNINRPNLEFSVRSINNSIFEYDIKEYLNSVTNGCIIIFISTDWCEQKFYSSAGFRPDIYLDTLDKSSKQRILNDFTTGKCKVLVTRVSPLNLEFYRSDLRLLIHYEYSNINLENYYRECLLAGLDGNPSKCIIFKKFECLRLEQITPKDTLRTYLNIKDCRRKLTLRHFGSIERFPTLESCCDNCQTILNDKIPPFKMYKDIDAKGFLNISVDARILMKLINAYKGKGIKYPIVDFLVGDVPKKHSKYHPLSLFASGKNKSENWWLNLIDQLLLNDMIFEEKILQNIQIVENAQNQEENELNVSTDEDAWEDLEDFEGGYGIEVNWQCFLRLSKKGKRFLEFKTCKLNMKPNQKMLSYLPKTDQEYFIEQGSIKSKKREVSE